MPIFLSSGNSLEELKSLHGVCYVTDNVEFLNGISVPSFEACSTSKEKYADACRIEYDEQDAVRGKRLIQKHGKKYLVQNPPMPPLTTSEMDEVYELPYERYYHPIYEKQGGVPAIEEVEFFNNAQSWLFLVRAISAQLLFIRADRYR